MKYLVSLLLVTSILGANDYYAKVEPIATYNVKSSVSGKVVFVNKDLESKRANNTIIVKIDDKINKVDLTHTRIKKNNVKKVLKIQKNILLSFNKVSSKSKLDKDQQKITILNTEASLNDLSIRIETLKDLIANKTLKEKNTYISSVNVEVGDYVNPGTLLYTAKDLNTAKLEIFVAISDIELIKNKDIYIDGKKSDLKISKIYKTADIKHISSYKVEILMNDVQSFSSLVKVSFK